MEKFIVSARKYRPQLFNTVVGQAHITTTLKNAIKNEQLAHAFLFCGPRGVGKTTCARILAKTINCETKTADGEACNICHSCTSFNEGISLNIYELDAASNNSVDDIRTLVEQVRFAPQAGNYKVYIIDEVHMLSQAAFNAFLKTLEEPPPYAIFILATTEKHKIIPTILSRCQIFDFKRITTSDTVHHLKEIIDTEKIEADTAALHVIAQKSEGCMRDALSMLDKIVSFTNGKLEYSTTLEQLNILDDDYYFKLMDCMMQQKLTDAMLLYDDINRKGFEGDMILNGFAELIRNLLVSKDEKSAALLDISEAFREKYLTTAKITPASLLISALNILNDAEINFKAARNKRLHVELTIIKLCYLQQALDLTAGNGSKKKIAETAKPLAFKSIVPIELRAMSSKPTGTESEKLFIEQKKNSSPIIDSLMPKQVLQEAETKIAAKKISALSKIRQQFQTIESTVSETSTLPLQLSALHQAWTVYADKLKENNNPAYDSFTRAELRLKDQNSFEAVSATGIEQKFIEQERNHLFIFLQEQLQVRNLQFSATVEERPGEKPAEDAVLPSKDQFLLLAEKYPLLKKLKDRLRLDLDY